MTIDEAIADGLIAFVARERMARDGLTVGGQQVTGSTPSVSVSALHELERMIRDAPKMARTYGTSRQRGQGMLCVNGLVREIEP